MYAAVKFPSIASSSTPSIPSAKDNTHAPSGNSGSQSGTANTNATTQTRDSPGDEGLALLQDCRLMRKDELQVMLHYHLFN